MKQLMEQLSCRDEAEKCEHFPLSKKERINE